MTGRPVRRRVLAEVERAGGWPVVLARIASGEQVSEVARSFGVSRSFFATLLHADRVRHALVVESRRRLEAARASGGRGTLAPSMTDEGSNRTQSRAECDRGWGRATRTVLVVPRTNLRRARCPPRERGTGELCQEWTHCYSGASRRSAWS
jgi:hypothetical protein